MIAYVLIIPMNYSLLVTSFVMLFIWDLGI